jgi:hypothetical protein
MKRLILCGVFYLMLIPNGYALVDTLWGEQFIEGSIGHYGYNNLLEAVSPVNGFAPGDGVDLIHGGENYERSYLSFNLDSLPDTITVISATLRLCQLRSTGNDTFGVWPKWTGVPGGDTMSCIIDHINYGALLDTLDWTAGDIGDPQTITNCFGPISTTPDTGWKTLDVTSCMQADLAASRNRTQFRMRFKVGSDYDGRGDRLDFYSSSSAPLYDKFPNIIINYLTGVEGTPNNAVNNNDTKIYQNTPNPFYGTTEINYHLKRGGKINIVIYNSQGREITTLVNKYQQPGVYTISWNGTDQKGNKMPNGIYFYQLTCGSTALVQKMVLLK